MIKLIKIDTSMLCCMTSETIQFSSKTGISLKIRSHLNISFKIGISLVDNRITVLKNLLIWMSIIFKTKFCNNCRRQLLPICIWGHKTDTFHNSHFYYILGILVDDIRIINTGPGKLKRKMIAMFGINVYCKLIYLWRIWLILDRFSLLKERTRLQLNKLDTRCGFFR